MSACVCVHAEEAGSAHHTYFNSPSMLISLGRGPASGETDCLPLLLRFTQISHRGRWSYFCKTTTSVSSNWEETLTDFIPHSSPPCVICYYDLAAWMGVFFFFFLPNSFPVMQWLVRLPLWAVFRWFFFFH